MVALTAAMAFTFTACNDDSTSAKEPSKVSKAEDLSKDCEDGEEALVGDKDVLYTCKDGKWTTEEATKSSASKPKSSSSKVEDSDADECDPDQEHCDEEEEDVKSSSSKKKTTSASSGDGTSSSSVNSDVDPSFKGEKDMDAAYCGDLWCGPNQDDRVKTGISGDYAGWWFFASDAFVEGSSEIQWPTEVTSDNFHNYIKADYGVEGKTVLGAGCDFPYTLVGFALYDADKKGADISDWNGLCVTYRATKKIQLTLVYSDGSSINDDYHIVELPATTTLTTVSYGWNSFAQQGFSVTPLSVDDAVKDISFIRFLMNETDNEFKIVSLGKAGSCKALIPLEFLPIAGYASWTNIDREKDVYEGALNKPRMTAMLSIMEEDKDTFKCEPAGVDYVKCTAGSHEALLSESKIRITAVTK